MEDYTHEAFIVSGYRISTTNNDNKSNSDIMAAWKKFQNQNLAEAIQGKNNPTLHIIYFNYSHSESIQDRSYDVLIGYTTDEGAVQNHPEIETLLIPAQNYKYEIVKGEIPEVVVQKWAEINAMPQDDLSRTFGFDMDMYMEDGSVCVTVAVK
ncbi:MAG: hypothetical protein OHK0017_12240 [Patescibacteria group bacterium]